MLILVKGDDVRGGKKANTCHGRLQPAQASMVLVLYDSGSNQARNFKLVMYSILGRLSNNSLHYIIVDSNHAEKVARIKVAYYSFEGIAPNF